MCLLKPIILIGQYKDTSLVNYGIYYGRKIFFDTGAIVKSTTGLGPGSNLMICKIAKHTEKGFIELIQVYALKLKGRYHMRSQRHRDRKNSIEIAFLIARVNWP